MNVESLVRPASSRLSDRSGGLLDRVYWVTDTVRDVRWLARNLPIAPSDLVLDVGSGSGPNLRSNVLCDKFPWDGTERHGRRIRLDRPFVMGDIERLPFADKAFDFVICSHVLEHVEHPERAVAELQRVGRRGYIETPSAAWERVTGFDFHSWMVSKAGDRLIFVEKRRPIEDPPLADWFDRFQSALHIRRYAWLQRRRAGMYTSLVWNNHIDIEVHRADVPRTGGFRGATLATNDTGGEAECQDVPGRTREGPTARALDRYGKYLRRHSDIASDALEGLLRCPSCHGELRRETGHTYRCCACGSDFPDHGEAFPVLIRREAVADSTAPDRARIPR
jgi:SAM-dependent methyltransferase